MKLALENFRSLEWRSKQREASRKEAADKAKKDATVALVPKVIQFNENNEPQGEVESIVVETETPKTEIIPWEEWLGKVVAAKQDEDIARHVFHHACLWVHTHVTTGVADASRPKFPIALETRKGKTKAYASVDILPGRLLIPVFCLRDNSIYAPSNKGNRAKDEVLGSVKWKQPVDESYVRDVGIQLGCQPERRQRATKMGTHKVLDSDLTTDCHPFWYIRRSYCVGEFNSAVVGIKTKTINSAAMTELKTDSYHHKPGMLAFEITIPCIVNNKELKRGTEIVLMWKKKADNIKDGQQTRNNKRAISAYSAGAPKFQKKTK